MLLPQMPPMSVCLIESFYITLSLPHVLSHMLPVFHETLPNPALLTIWLKKHHRSILIRSISPLQKTMLVISASSFSRLAKAAVPEVRWNCLQPASTPSLCRISSRSAYPQDIPSQNGEADSYPTYYHFSSARF